MVRTALLGFLVWSVSTGLAGAQPGGAGGRGAIGRILSTVPLEHPIAVHLEGQASQVQNTVFTDGSGNFPIGDLDLRTLQYISVEVDGFRPVRQRFEQNPLTRGAGGVMITIVLEPLVTLADAVETDSNLVDLRQLMAEIPEDAQEEFRNAATDAQTGNSIEAARRLERAIEIAPDFYEAHNALGFEYMRLGRNREAEARLENAKSLNPNAPAPLVYLGILHLRESEFERQSGNVEAERTILQKAVDSLDEAVGRDPLSTTAHMYLGAALYAMGSHERAATALGRALDLDEDLDDVLFMLVDVHVSQGDFETALNRLTAFLHRNPDSPRRPEVEGMVAELRLLLGR